MVAIWLQETLQQYQQLVQSLDRVVQPEEGLHPALQPKEGDEAPLQVILHNLYRYLTAVAANLDRLHEAVADARQAFLDQQKQVPPSTTTSCSGDLRFVRVLNKPFLHECSLAMSRSSLCTLQLHPADTLLRSVF